MREELIQVEGMTCGHCKSAVEGAAAGVKGVTNAEVNLDKGNVLVKMEDNADLAKVIEEIEDQGYDVKK
ncbi:cation transporter [Alkalicoccus daliensis]|uniref:Copper chaperone n=1 Tax=Alkalicoccus daliensis TaxID=745820 RepID=A0A1H0AEC2_9BACI|nr:cation transporter [Alkalicoccus daliensis]SDN31106.1 copper chaperone [Alkalicoccus daliensis]